MGHYSVRSGHTVYINDSNIFRTPGDEANLAQSDLHHRELQVQLRIFSAEFQLATPPSESISSDNGLDLSVTGYTALFGVDLSLLNASSTPSLSILRPEGVPIRREELNRQGCVPFERSYPNSALLVHRGQCTFLEKLLYARAASASAVIIISDDDFAINPTANPDELEAAGDLSDSAAILLPKKTGKVLEDVLIAISKLGTAEIRVSVDTKRGEDLERSLVEKDKRDERATRILHINGYPLINTRLLV